MKQGLRIWVMSFLILFLLTQTAYAAQWTPILSELSTPSVMNEAISGYMLVDPEASIRIEAQGETEPISSTALAALLVNAYLTVESGGPNALVEVNAGIRALPSRERKLRVGTTYGRMDLVHAMLMTGARDAALALALGDGQDEAGFVQRMNAQAAQWGLTNTVFVNATGRWDPAQKTTLADLSVIAAQVMRVPAIGEILQKTEYTMAKDIGYGAKIERSWAQWEPRVRMGMNDSGESPVYLQYAVDGTRHLLLIAYGAGSDVPAQVAAAKSLIAHGFGAYQKVDLWELAQGKSITIRIGDAEVAALPAAQEAAMPCIVPAKRLQDQGITIVPKQETVEAFTPTMYYADADVMLGSARLGTIQLYAHLQEVITPEPALATPEPTRDAIAVNVRPSDANREPGNRMPMLLIWIGFAAVAALGMNGLAWFIRRNVS